ncbi:MAG: tetratricopeptide repeat protein, partial [Acidobacteriota bacterium]|nr:tetratricopeptide repeat protein [Acidobacteriota bacterium]
ARRNGLIAFSALLASAMPALAEDGHFEAGLALYRKGECGRALAEFSLSEGTAEKRPARLFYQGVCLARGGDLSFSSAKLLEYVSAEGSDPRGWEWLSRVQLLQRRFSEARTSAQRAIALNPNSFEAHRTLGETELELRNSDAAYRAWTEANRLNPKDARTTYYLGRLFFEADFTGEAAAWLRDTLRLEPTHFGAMTYLGLCAEHLGQTTTATGLYREAIRQSKLQRTPFSWGYLSLAKLLRQQGNDGEALTLLEECEKLCPEAHALSILGQLLIARQQTDRAESVLRRAIEMDPGISEAHYRLSRILQASGRTGEAQAELRQFEDAKKTEEKAKNDISAIRK